MCDTGAADQLRVTLSALNVFENWMWRQTPKSGLAWVASARGQQNKGGRSPISPFSPHLSKNPHFFLL